MSSRKADDGMNAIVLILPPLLIRYGLLFVLNKTALERAAFFPPRMGVEKTAYWIYQLSTLLIVLSLCFLHVRTGSWWFRIGIVAYIAGLLIFAWATASFAFPSGSGFNRKGLYRISRNPMYVGYFVCFLGCVLLTRSIQLLALVLVFQVSSHWIILSEERWCREVLGEEYTQYMREVRRYL